MVGQRFVGRHFFRMIDTCLNLRRVNRPGGVLRLSPRLSNAKIAQRDETRNSVISQRAITQFLVEIGHNLPLCAIDRDRLCRLAPLRGFLAGLIDEVG